MDINQKKLKILFLIVLHFSFLNLQKINNIKLFEDRQQYKKRKFYFDYSKIRVNKKVKVFFE